METNKKRKKFSETKFGSFILKLWHWTRSFTKVKLIFLTYLIVVLVITLFLYSPITQNEEYVQSLAKKGESITFIDAFFTTCSAFSDTGLVSHPTYLAWNQFGQALIAFSILIGGLGIFALKIFLINFIFLRGKTSLNDVELVSYERGNSEFFKTKHMIRDSILFLLIILILSSIGLTIYFYYKNPTFTESDFITKNGYILENNYVNPASDWSTSFRFGFFHAISALNNAGFDIIGNNSLLPYFYNYDLQIIFVVLFIIGGIGYPVIYDFFTFIKFKIYCKKNKIKSKYKWSLFTKISLSAYWIMTIITFAGIMIIETSGNKTFINSPTFANGNYFAKVWALFFTTLSTRSAGFATFYLNDLSQPTLWILNILMYIGASPASTGGGIRTTTFAILILTIFSKILGKPSVRVFDRKIDVDTVKMSTIVSTISLILVLLTSLVIMSSLNTFHSGTIDDTKYTATNFFFEAFSAFGTTGLTTGITDNLNWISKIALSILMFIGQFGISSSVLIWIRKKNYSYQYDYISESVAIG